MITVHGFMQNFLLFAFFLQVRNRHTKQKKSGAKAELLIGIG